MKEIEQGELVCKLANGWSIRIGPGGTWAWGAYVRVCTEKGNEVLYYDQKEWEEEPEQVIGALFSCAVYKRKV